MKNFFKKTSIKLSLITSLIVTPSIVIASSSSGFIDASSESTSVAFEQPTYEGQIARINIGINLIRINTDLLERMPISPDAQWVDKVVDVVPVSNIVRKIMQEDPYYSTVRLTNALLGRTHNISISPLTARLYYIAGVIYKNKENGYNGFHIPDMDVFPDISDIKTFTTFKDDPKVQVIDIEAKDGFYKNVVEAVISLLPDNLQEDIIDARKEMIDAQSDLDEIIAQKTEIETWLDDDKNSENPQRTDKEEELEILKAKEDEAKGLFDEKEDTYISLLESGAQTIESDFDSSKIPLAKKLDKLLDTIDNNAMGAITMFSVATAGLVRGVGTIEDEMKAIAMAQTLTTLVGNQKEFLMQRYKRMLVGAVMAIPNITIGTYKAISQSSEIGKYQDIVETILEGAKAEEESVKASKE